MIRFTPRLIGALMLAGALACAGGRPDRMPETGRSCDFVPVYAADPASPPAGAAREDKHWVRIRAVLSESGFDFGYLNDRGNFIELFSGAEGTFECLGGVYYPFAIRTGSPSVTVYPMADYGTCEAAGETVPASRAVQPPPAHDYSSAVQIHLRLPDQRKVSILLSAIPPNGFDF